jgi:3-isopropylmalate/(R)-2-methylmalate dehydratase large subunit
MTMQTIARAVEPTAPVPLTLAEKVWAAHVLDQREGEPDLLYIDLHLTHEATSPQAFDGLRSAGRRVHRPDLTLAVEDHNVPTDTLVIRDPVGRAQVEALRRNCAEFGIKLFRLGDEQQGIVHVVGPENGLVQPGMTVVCGDSHTSTHGALGALAFGIGTSEVEHVLATQTLGARPWRTMRVAFEGELPEGVTAKDLMLAFIAQVGPNGAAGHIVEYTGPVVENLSVEARMTLCNMTIEAGARAGIVGPDQRTFDYLRGRRYAPTGAEWAEAVAAWTELHTDPGAAFDRELVIDVGELSPYITWGTNPGQAVALHDAVPDPEQVADPAARSAAVRALAYMDLAPGDRLSDCSVGAVFIGSCTNGRIEDLREAARVFAGRRVAPGVDVLIVPGSMAVKAQAEAEGLARVFEEAGAQWRNPGCSMCLGMNPDRLAAGTRCVATSNRNFEGRQGAGARTHLASPAVAAASAVAGRIAAPADLPAPTMEGN